MFLYYLATSDRPTHKLWIQKLLIHTDSFIYFLVSFKYTLFIPRIEDSFHFYWQFPGILLIFTYIANSKITDTYQFPYLLFKISFKICSFQESTICLTFIDSLLKSHTFLKLPFIESDIVLFFINWSSDKYLKKNIITRLS